MAVDVFRHLDRRQIGAIALGFDGATRPPDRGARTGWQRARDRLARRLLCEFWASAAALDVGVWGPIIARAEADRTLHEAAARGAMYLDPVPETPAPDRRPGRSLARLLWCGARLRRAAPDPPQPAEEERPDGADGRA
jgi:hypothetical protein